MKQLVTAQSMRSAEKRTFESGVVPLQLMENAAQCITDFVAKHFKPPCSVCAVCGKGNNGGDGLAAARQLFSLGFNVTIIMAMGEPKTPDAAINLKKAQECGIPVLFDDYSPLCGCDVIIDAVLGIGISGGVELAAVDEINKSRAFKVAADIPTGINSDTGAVLKKAVKADATVTFGYAKTGLVQYPGKEYAGELTVHKIGIKQPPEFDAHMLQRSDILPHLCASADANKGNFGRLLVFAGSIGMTGAAALCCSGALRSGCGLVTLAVPQNLNAVMEIKLTEAMTLPLKCSDKITFSAAKPVLDSINKYSAVVIGPGLGKSDEVFEIIQKLICSGIPVVIDADGINSLAANINILKSAKGQIVLTPHPGEFSRLCGKSIQEIQQNRLFEAKELSQNTSCTVVLKGAATVTATPNSGCFINPTGNAGMATGGSGDVLSGIVGAFLARGMSAGTAAAAAVYVHGLAGDFAAKKLGEISMTAGDIIRFLPAAFQKIKP